LPVMMLAIQPANAPKTTHMMKLLIYASNVVNFVPIFNGHIEFEKH